MPKNASRYRYSALTGEQLRNFLRVSPDPSMYADIKHKDGTVTPKRFKYLGMDDIYGSPWSQPDKVNFMVCFDNPAKKVVGLCLLRDSPHKEEEHITWLSFLCVDLHHRKQGIATQLTTMAFKHLEQKKRSLLVSTYSFYGKNYLQPVIERVGTKYKVPIIPREGCDHDFGDLDEKEEKWMQENIPGHKHRLPAPNLNRRNLFAFKSKAPER